MKVSNFYGPEDFNPETYNPFGFPELKPHPDQKEYMDGKPESDEPMGTYKRKGYSPHPSKRVIDVETGVIYDSIKDCAIEHCVNYGKIHAMFKYTEPIKIELWMKIKRSVLCANVITIKKYLIESFIKKQKEHELYVLGAERTST